MAKNSSKLTDTEIISKIIQGDVDVFAYLIERYQKYVFNIVVKHVPYAMAEEVSQSIFIESYRSLVNYKNKNNFKYWLAKIAVRKCYDYWRKEYRRKELIMAPLSEEQKQWIDSVITRNCLQQSKQESEKEKAKEVLSWALNKLSARERIVLKLIYFEGLSIKEAANLLGWSMVNTKVQSFRAKKKLRNLLLKLIKGGQNEPH